MSLPMFFVLFGSVAHTEEIGSGQDFIKPTDLLVEADGSIVVIDTDLKAILRVDPISGDRTILSYTNTGSGPEFDDPLNIAVEADDSLLVIDKGQGAVVRQDKPHKW